MTVLLVALGAALGAPLRFAVASALDEDRFPWGTLAVNVTGSFLLGLFVALG
ncbi:MAG TPA: CrcB family protein, partial [Nocardioides sp.]|nr:CrcB family protein [Nocardioides sp.]